MSESQLARSESKTPAASAATVSSGGLAAVLGFLLEPFCAHHGLPPGLATGAITTAGTAAPNLWKLFKHRTESKNEDKRIDQTLATMERFLKETPKALLAGAALVPFEVQVEKLKVFRTAENMNLAWAAYEKALGFTRVQKALPAVTSDVALAAPAAT